MDEDIVFGIVLLFFFLILITLPLSITGCIAASNTRKWSKDKARRIQLGPEEGVPLTGADSDDESEIDPEDILDSEDEDYYNAKKEQKVKERGERMKDMSLSAGQKFCSEWKKCWTGPGKDSAMAEKEMREKDERRKIAREAVREYLRVERRKARKAAGAKRMNEGVDAPRYDGGVKKE